MKSIAIHVCLLFIVTISALAQSCNSGLIFSGDLNILSQNKATNVRAYNNDDVRGKVVDLLAHKSDAFKLNNNLADSVLTVSFWFRPQHLDIHSGTLFGEDSVFYLRYLTNREIQFNHFFKKDIHTVGVLANDIWQHIGFTLKKSGDLTIYFNGDSILNDSISRHWWNRKRANFIIGDDCYGLQAEGRMDGLKIWNRALSYDEFIAEYNSTQAHPNLLHKLTAYLPLQGDFDDKSGSSIQIEEVQNIDFIDDSIKGVVANLDTEESYIKIKGLSFDNQISIAVWSKISKKKRMMTLAGNNDFSFRYSPKRQQLWYSVPLLFRSVSKSLFNHKDEWQHLAVTVNYNHKANYYINGHLIDSKPVGGKTGNEDYLEIGRSLWGNAYNGQLCHFAIWDRTLTADEIKRVYQGKLETDMLLQQQSGIRNIYLVAFGVMTLLLLTILLWFVLKRKKRTTPTFVRNQDSNFAQRNAIFLFDNFRAFNKDGKNISYEFTPSLIRVFTLILLFPQLKNRNVSSAELSDILWENDTLAQQKSSRGTSIYRLRKLLTQFEGISLDYQDRYWVLNYGDELFIDIIQFESSNISEIINLPYTNLQLNKAIKTDGFDSIILQLNELHIEVVRKACENCTAHKNWKLLSKIALLWLSIDSLSELALRHQLKALLTLNQKQSALDAYQHFSSNYKLMLNEYFTTSFADLT